GPAAGKGGVIPPEQPGGPPRRSAPGGKLGGEQSHAARVVAAAMLGKACAQRVRAAAIAKLITQDLLQLLLGRKRQGGEVHPRNSGDYLGGLFDPQCRCLSLPGVG